MKKLISMICAIILLAALCAPVLASESRLDNVTDDALLLTDAECAVLNENARRITEKYNCGVYIITLDDFRDYADTDDIYEAARSIYQEYDLGWGGDKSGVLLLLSLNGRDYALISDGYGNTAFTDFGKDKLAEEFLDDFENGDWYVGFEDYLVKSAGMLESARAGEPLDAGNAPGSRLMGILVSIGLGCLLALLICYFLRRSMKSVSAKAEAGAYLNAGSVDFRLREDHFTHTTQTRVKIEKKSGGTTVDSAGFSGKSGKF